MANSRRRNAGKAVITLSLDDRVSKGLKNIEARFARMGSNIARIGRAGLVVGTTLAAAFVAPIASASALQETMNKFDVVFGDNATAVKAWGDEFAEQVGRSKRQIADFLASSQDLFVPLGFEPGAATEMSKQITGLAVDLASFNNSTDDAALRDLQAALTGSGEVMKKYGVLVNEAAVKQQLLTDGLDPRAATDQQKVQARMNIIMAGTTAAQGDAIRSAGSYANQVKALKGSLSDLSAEIGGAILPHVTAFVGMLKNGVIVVREFAERHAGLIRVIAGVAVGVGAAGAVLLAVGLGFQVAAFAVSGFATAASAVAGIVAGLVSPLGLVAVAIAGLTAWFVTSTETGQQLVEKLGDGFGKLFGIAKETFGGISNLLAAGEIEAAGELLWAGLKLIWLEGTSGLRDKWAQFVEGIKEAWINAGTFLVDVGVRILNSINDGFSLTAEFIVVTLQKAFFAVGDILQAVAIGILETFDAIFSRIGLGIESVVAQAKKNREEFAAFGEGAIERVQGRAQNERETRGKAVEEFLGNLRIGQNDRLAKVDGSADREIEENRKELAEMRAAFERMRDAAKELNEVVEAEKEVAKKKVKPASVGVGTIGARGVQPQAILDARFAGQHFGSARNKEEDLLERIADSNDKIKDKLKPGKGGCCVPAI